MTDRIAILKDRARMFSAARIFFADRGIVEVDCPLISRSASVDAHIDLIPVQDSHGKWRYLHSSPEYAMKRLLSEGIGDIYQLAHVFRQGEESPKHNPEFMMAEWYRLGIPFEAMIDETLDFTRLFLGDLPAETISYREALRKYAGIDYPAMDAQQLFDFLKGKGVEVYPTALEEGKDALLNQILGIFVEAHLGKEGLCALAYYPASQAALAQTRTLEGEQVAERFEVYYKGMELANGYHELADSREQRMRLQEANEARIALGKSPLPIDEHFLQALEKGLPECCGVAVGVDRLMMLRHNSSDIADVFPFTWNRA